MLSAWDNAVVQNVSYHWWPVKECIMSQYAQNKPGLAYDMTLIHLKKFLDLLKKTADLSDDKAIECNMDFIVEKLSEMVKDLQFSREQDFWPQRFAMRFNYC